jgi:hypothetical protein
VIFNCKLPLTIVSVQLALRFAQNTPLNTSLSALLSLQISAVSSHGSSRYQSKRIKVMGKLTNKVVTSEHEKYAEKPFDSVDLKAVLPLLHECLRALSISRGGNRGTDLFKPAEEMAKSILMELIKAKSEAVRETAELLGLRDTSMRTPRYIYARTSG